MSGGAAPSWHEDPPYSVRRLRAEYLARVSNSTTSRPARHRVFGSRPTPSLPYIPEAEEERRSSWSQVEQLPPPKRPSSAQKNEPSEPPPPPPLSAAPPTPPPPPTNLNRGTSRSQLLYPLGSTDNIASERKPAERPPEKVVYENKPIPPSVVAVQVQDAPAPGRGRSRDPEHDYPERLMSPPPNHQPRSILKGYSSQKQYYESTHEMRPPSRTHFEDLSEEEKNPNYAGEPPETSAVEEHSQWAAASAHQLQWTFLQAGGSQSQSAIPPTNGVHQQQTREFSYTMSQMSHMSASEMELDRHNSGKEDPSVVIWPPLSDKERPRSHSVMSRNIADPDRIDEYRRQKRLEEEAMRRHDEQQYISMSKQIRAIQIQQQRLYEQQHGVTSPVPIMDSLSPAPQASHYPPHYSQTQQPAPVQHFATTTPSFQPQDDPQTPPSHVRVFETRPISALSDAVEPDGGQPPTTSWKRTYIVEKPADIAKNEILTSDELLEREQYEVDLLKRREAFVEKPEDSPQIQRTGKRWQPPPEKPYVWPTLRRPISVEPTMEPTDYPVQGDEYKWTPVVNDPGYKREHKNFTPVSSPPASPRRGHGAGPLDEPAKRQTKYVIQPSPDGSHRPKPAFRKERHAPSGGFFPHAPNAIKIVKRRAASAQGLLTPSVPQEDERVEVLHQRNYHRLDAGLSERTRREMMHSSEHDLRAVPDWEKIYELPPHSSQLVSKEMPRHVDVRRRLSQFENSAQQRSHQRTSSVESWSFQQPHYPLPDYEAQPLPPPPPPPPAQPRSLSRHDNPQQQYRHHPQHQQMSRRNSVASTRIDTPPMTSHRSERRNRGDSRLDSRGPSRAASTIPLSPQPRPTTPGASRARNFIARATAPSPTPYAYDRARPYVPPALPPGYRVADGPDARHAGDVALAGQHEEDDPERGRVDPTTPSDAPGLPRPIANPLGPPHHRQNGPDTKKGDSAWLVESADKPRPSRLELTEANKPPPTTELDELARKNEELSERSKALRSQYKLIDSEIVKQNPEPLPAQFKDQVRELLESRNSVDTTTSARDQDRSGYVTDVSTATWQFSTHSFSPRSIVSMNGARDDILKAVPPRREPPPPPKRYDEVREERYEQRYASLPTLQPAIIHIQDEKPRSIMKRRELESREQLLYPQENSQVVKSYSRSTSNVAKPTVTETVQRFEETRRTEEVERRVQRREKKERRSRHHSSSRHHSGWESGGYNTNGYHAEFRYASLPRRTIVRESDRAMTNEEMDKVVREAYEAADEARREHRHRSSSLSRGGYVPGGQETYYRHETTRRHQNSNQDDFNRGIAHARYGSLSDSLRRGELKYVPNGEVRESYYRDGSRNMHKSHSTRDVFGGQDDRRSVSSYRRGSQQMSPFVEFPPTLPRRSERDENYFRPVSKSRSYADWDDAGRSGFGREVRRYDDDMGRLEAEFRDSLLMPMPNGNLNEKDHRTEQIPGGYETFNKERHANSGRRAGRDGRPVDYNEASQEYNYKREQQFDDRRRR
ncbi:unnamed protein product [Caenorhabditis auriculariae]|uniref:Uncharacterized protein n=1 Tax=Caenorhabditis auriculariae TaxID=2777116 RepID=A0A8S1HWY4_9PELO|nr:unnamed protein product [Caenorhabditis auriculariae]